MISPLGIASGWFVLIVTYFSSVVINALQLVVWCCVFLPSKTRLAAAQYLSNLWWEIFCFILEVWGDVPFVSYGDAIGSRENAIMIGNHCAGSLDFASGVCITARAGGIGTGKMMTMMKSSLQFVPTVGWTHVLQGSLFLRRNWETDHKALSAKLADMESGRFPKPFWVGLYPEGTRITPAKWKESVKFASENPAKGLPVLNNVLLPRTKGFVFLVRNLPTSIECVYDVTIGYSGKPPAIGDAIFRGKMRCKGIHVHVQRIAFADIPKDDKGISAWLMQRFVAKDQLLAHFNANGVFPGERRGPRDNAQETDRLFKRWSALWLVWGALFSLFMGWATGRPLVQWASLALTVYTLIAGWTLVKRDSKTVHAAYHPVHANGRTAKGKADSAKANGNANGSGNGAGATERPNGSRAEAQAQ